jgi:hypothetical protein
VARSTVAVRFTGDTADLKRALGDVDGGFKKVDSRLGSTGGKLASFGKSAALGVGAAAVGVAALGKAAVDAGSDLNESLSKSNTVFGTQGKAIEKFADNAAKNLGQSKQQALEAASSFGNMFVQLGIGESQAAGLSQNMTILASDFASFHNADITEVLTAQQAAFRGEYDAIQRFVPTINAAAVEQEALRQTGKKTTAELTAQEKALAAQALMMSGAGDAAGDFARTSDGLANKQRIMSAQFADVQAKVGQALIPVVLKLADVFMTRVIPAMQMIADKVREHWPQIQASIQGAVEGVQAAVVPIVSALQALWDNFGNNILELMQRIWPSIQQTISGALEIIKGTIQVVTSLIQGDWGKVWDGIKMIVHGAFNVIVGRIKQALELIRFIAGGALEILGSIFKAAWDGIKGAVAGAWDGIKGLVKTGVDGLISIVQGIPGRVTSLASGAFDGIKNAFRSAINWVIDKWNGLSFTTPKISAFGFESPSVTIGTPNIPRLAEGGIVKRTPGGILANIGEGRYDEAVVPLNGKLGASSGGLVVNINVQVPPTMDAGAAGQAITESLAAYVRRNGANDLRLLLGI